MMGHTLRRGGLLRDILKGEVGKKRGRPRLEYFDHIIKDMECETFRQVKELAWEELSGGRWLCQTSLRTVCSIMMIMMTYLLIERLVI